MIRKLLLIQTKVLQVSRVVIESSRCYQLAFPFEISIFSTDFYLLVFSVLSYLSPFLCSLVLFSTVVWDYHVFVLVTCTLPTSTSSPTIDELSDQFPTSPNIGVPDTPTESPDPSFSTLPRKRRPSFFKKRSKSRPDSPASPMESISAFPHPNQSQNTFLSQDFSKSTSTRVPYAWVYDFDSILSSSKSLARSSQNGNRFYPVALENYLSSTFKNLVSEQEMINPKLNPYFRVIPSRDYLSNFSSDRSHMLIEGINPSDILATHPSSYLFPPPTWHKICGKEAFERGEEVGGNLKKWLKVNAGDQDDMGGFGKVYDFKDFHNGKWLEEMGGESNGRSKETTTRGNHRRPAPPPPDASSLPTRMRSESNSERPVGGRITSPDFPAYLASALANRAGRARGSYIGLEGQGNS